MRLQGGEPSPFFRRAGAPSQFDVPVDCGLVCQVPMPLITPVRALSLGRAGEGKMATAGLSGNGGHKFKLLDLFCCAGGAGIGYSRAGFEVVGVDIEPQPNYPLTFIQADALNLDRKFVGSFDAIHASPPCQSYSDLAKRNGNADAWPRLIAPVRNMLIKSGLPYVIENVDGAPLRNPIVLCGTMFPGLRVVRHRLFETSFLILHPPTVLRPPTVLELRPAKVKKTMPMASYPRMLRATCLN